ncbi:MAG TPA: Ig domain-containing protein [Terriglobales bacterium]|nr:Ig domain-containing protein [Terriglobales bacterium]
MSPLNGCFRAPSRRNAFSLASTTFTAVLISSIIALTLVTSSCGSALGAAPQSSAKSDKKPGDSNGGHLTVSGTLPAATIGIAYTGSIQVSGGSAPYQFSVVYGSLPAGLSLNSKTGTISGTALTVGSYLFSVGATDPSGDYGDHRFTVTVSKGSGSKIIVTVSPSSASMTSGGAQQFTASVRETSITGVTWSASAGTISSSGLFTAPTVAAATAVTITATSTADSTAKGTAAVSVAPAGTNSLSVTTSSLPSAIMGMSYSATLAASGGKIPYQWSMSQGSLPPGLQLNSSTGTISGTPNQTGTFQFTARVKDSSSQTASQGLDIPVSTQNSGGYDGPAQLPQIYLQTALANTPAPGQTISVAAGGDFQSALNSAACGDTVSLQAGATFTGTFTLPAKGCDDAHWIIIRTSASDSSLPAEGTRMTPCYAGVSSLPGRPALNCKSTQNVLAKLNFAASGTGPIIMANGATHYRLLGLEITRSTGTGVVYSMASIASGGQADHIYFDRVWMHGTALDETTRGLQLGGSTYMAMIDSYLNDFHCISITGACTDAQAISGGIGNFTQGPYKISDNFLEAASENILFGGGGATVAPTDIEITRNHFFKPLTWLKGQSGYVGVAFVVKNHLELKNAQRVLVDGNIMENTWGGFSQSGFSIVVTPKNQNNACPSCLVTDVTIRYNTSSHMGSGMQIANGLSDAGGAPYDGERYSIHDDVFDDINATTYVGSGVFAQVSMGNGTPVLQNLSMEHLTGFAPSELLNVGDTTTVNPLMNNFNFINSIVNAGTSPVWSTGGGSTNCAYSDVPITTMTACFTNSSLTSNAIIATPQNFPSTSWPAGNFFPANAAAVQFVNYNNGNGGDYHLQSGSPYKNAGTDGKDLGADIDTILSETAGVY